MALLPLLDFSLLALGGALGFLVLGGFGFFVGLFVGACVGSSVGLSVGSCVVSGVSVGSLEIVGWI
jgi:hypothetical protein